MRHLAILVSLAVLLFHVSMTAIYLMPASMLKIKFGDFANTWINNPINKQDWHLFSPEPSIEKTRIWMQCHHAQDSSPFFDPISDKRRALQANLASGGYKMLYIHRAMLMNVLKFVNQEFKTCAKQETVCNTRKITQGMVGLPILEPLTRLAQDSCKRLWKDSDAATIKIIEYLPAKYSERHLDKITDSAKSYPFELRWSAL